MEKIWQHAYFLICLNDILNINELKCAENACQKMFHQATHKLLVKGKNVMRLPFTECATGMSLTCCWS